MELTLAHVLKSKIGQQLQEDAATALDRERRAHLKALTHLDERANKEMPPLTATAAELETKYTKARTAAEKALTAWQEAVTAARSRSVQLASARALHEHAIQANPDPALAHLLEDLDALEHEARNKYGDWIKTAEKVLGYTHGDVPQVDVRTNRFALKRRQARIHAAIGEAQALRFEPGDVSKRIAAIRESIVDVGSLPLESVLEHEEAQRKAHEKRSRVA